VPFSQRFTARDPRGQRLADQPPNLSGGRFSGVKNISPPTANKNKVQSRKNKIGKNTFIQHLLMKAK